MTVRGQLRSGDVATLPSTRLIPLLVGTCEKDPGGGVTLDPGDDVTGVLGGGRLAEAVLLVHAATGRRVEARRATPTYGALPSVTQTGSGPAIALAASSGSPGPLYPYALRARVAVAGANGAAQLAIAYDGVTEIETVTIPEEPRAVLRGKVDLTGLSLSGLNAKQLTFTAPAAKVITWATTPTSVQDIADDFNTAAEAAPLAARARIYQAATGEQYLELYSTAGGSGVSLTIDATASDADSILGFNATAPANISATGSTAKISLPWTGVDLVCDAGTYELDAKYSASLPGPTASIANVIAAVDAAIADYNDHPFGRVFVVDPPTNQTNARGLSDALASTCATAIANPDTPVYVDFCAPTALHTASAVKATNDANIASNDAAMSAAFAGASAVYVKNRVHGDCYVAGSSELRPGLHRQSAIFAGAVKHAGAEKMAANPGDGTILGVSLLGPDQRTRARDEASATTKLGKLTGPGAWVLKSTSKNAVKFDVAATMAGPTSRLRSPGAVSTGLEILRVIFGQVEAWEGQTPETDATAPKAIAPEEAETRANDLHAELAPVLTPSDPNTPANVSGDFTVKVTAPLLADDGASDVRVAFNPLAEIGEVNVIVTATAAKLA